MLFKYITKALQLSSPQKTRWVYLWMHCFFPPRDLKSSLLTLQWNQTLNGAFYRCRGLNLSIHRFTGFTPSLQRCSSLSPCRPCSGKAGGKARWARSICLLPTSRRGSRSSVRPPTRQSPVAKRPASPLTSSVSSPFFHFPEGQFVAFLFYFSAKVELLSFQLSRI